MGRLGLMRAVPQDVTPELLEERRRLGHDRWDEVWEGVLHMVPPPHGDHGQLNDCLACYFFLHWQTLGLGRTFLETGVKRPRSTPVPELGGVPDDYRTPDRSFLLPGRFDRYQGGWIVGGPDVALEIESPGDETRKKMPFYLDVGVRELVIIGRITCRVEVFRSVDGAWQPVPSGAEGWLPCELLRTELRTETGPGGQPALRIRRRDEPGRELLCQA